MPEQTLCLSRSRVKPACCNQESIPGYESDLTRKTSSKGSDSSQSNSPVSGRSVVLLPSPSTSSSSSTSSTSSSMYQQPLEMKTLEGGGESRNVEHLAGSAAHNAPASYSVCHPPAERPDTRDNGKKVAVARPEEFVKTEIFIDHPLDGHAAAANLGGEQRREKEEEEEEKGEQRDLSLESITTTNGAISTSGGASSWGESKGMVVTQQPDFQIGTRSTPLASQQLPIHPSVILDSSKGDSDSLEEAANKTDEEKLTSISPMSDEDKLTAIFLCTDSDNPTEPSAGGDLESTSKKDERVPSSPDNQSAECCDEKQLAPKKDIWGLGGEMGNGSSNEELADQGVSLPNSLPPPLETEKDLAENQDVSVTEEEEGEEECVRRGGGDDDSIEYPATSGDTSTPPPDVGEEKKEEDYDYEGEEVASEKEQELPFSDVGLQSPASSSSTTNRLQQPDTENVTSLQVEWTKEEEEEVEEMLTPFGRGLVHDDAGHPMAQPQRALARSEDPQVIPEAHLYFLKTIFSLSPPCQSTLVNRSLQG